uniref:Uncharacterized protein n=1 Tax=Haptolina ericina TaxID=156174 RepID=A0A6T9FIH3_9EUKA|mmetsp:Transcript_35032/g.79462  ORF Transcript_35032/g.79462 Transcript_35032/m.79462 type:complete len:276 (+) Transcript_35032:36-863(+)
MAAMGLPGMAELDKTEYDQNTTVVKVDGQDEVYYEVFGEDMQILHLKMATGKTITALPGSMVYMQNHVKGSCNCGPSTCCGRWLSCNPCCMATYSNGAKEEHATVAISPLLPAKIIPLAINAGQTFRMVEKSFLASTGKVNLAIDFDCNPCTCCFGGQGCVRQTLSAPEGGEGVQGVGFIGAMGTIMTKTLAEGETIDVDTDSVVAWDATAKLGIKLAGGCCAICCGGEGLFNTTLTGPGQVYFQSYSFPKYKAAMTQFVLSGKAGGVEGDEMER